METYELQFLIDATTSSDDELRTATVKLAIFVIQELERRLKGQCAELPNPDAK